MPKHLYGLDWYKNRRKQTTKSSKKLVADQDYAFIGELIAEQLA